MGNEKITESYTIQSDQKAWLESMAEKHNLPDTSKALRVLLDFAIESGDEGDIFDTIRCRHCG